MDIVDSLLHEYAVAATDSARRRICVEIGMESEDVDTVAKYSRIGISLFDGKDSASLANCYAYLSWSLSFKDEYDKSIAYNEKALEIYKKLGDNDSYCLYAISLARSYQEIKSYKKSWSCLYDALTLALQNNDTANLCYCYNTIAEHYNEQKMSALAREAALKSLRLGEASQRYVDMAQSAMDIAGSYICEDTASCRTAIKWGLQAINYSKKSGDKSLFNAMTLLDAYNNLADNYILLFDSIGDRSYIDSALCYLNYLDKLNDDYGVSVDDFYIMSLILKAKIHNALGESQKAKDILLEVLALSDENDLTFYLSVTQQNLAIAYQKLGDYRNALKYFELYRRDMIAVHSLNALMETAAFEARSDVEQENKKIEAEKKVAIQEYEFSRLHFRKMMTASMVTLAAIIAIVVIVISLLRNTRKASQMLVMSNEEIKAQNDEITSEKNKLAATNSMIRQSMNYARRIQLATVSSEQELSAVFPGSLVYYKPSEIVSGDWYWISRLGSKRLLAVGGSAKHGVPGALVSMMTVNVLKDTIGQLSAASIVSPSAILRTVKAKLPAAARSNAAGLTLCVFGLKTLKFAAVNQNAMLLKGSRFIVMKGDQPGDMVFTVSPGDSVYAYSASTKQELLCYTSTPEKFCHEISCMPVEQQKDTIESLFADRPQSADITVVGIKI